MILEAINLGFRVIPILRGYPRPDLIALRNNKVYAVEVQVNQGLNIHKADNYFDVPEIYDDIIWIIDRSKTVLSQKVA